MKHVENVSWWVTAAASVDELIHNIIFISYYIKIYECFTDRTKGTIVTVNSSGDI